MVESIHVTNVANDITEMHPSFLINHQLLQLL